MAAYRCKDGTVKLGGTLKHVHEFPQRYLTVPCGKCIGCYVNNTRQWAIRCHLEDQAHEKACVVTLTFAEKYLPPTLRKSDIKDYLKRVRSRIAHKDKRDGKTPRKVKHFACGEYGDKRGRPHYHVILFGISKNEADEMQKRTKTVTARRARGKSATASHTRKRARIAEAAKPDAVSRAWPLGNVHSDALSPAAIAYVAGYVNKKRSQQKAADPHERISKDGECYRYQPPFRLMSLRPGIGQAAREKFASSWRSKAVWQGVEVAVPKYLHEGWLKTATVQEQLELQEELTREAIKSLHHKTPARLRAAETIAWSKHTKSTGARAL